jgi:hypothetical protein
VAARLMNALHRTVHSRWDQCCDALHPDPHLTLLEALHDTSLAAAHTVTPFTQDAERMESPHVRARLPLQKLEGVVKGLQGRVQYGRRHKRRCSRQRSIHGE